MPDTVKIEKIVYGGEGLGHLSDGRTIFVPFTLPGETVQIELTEEKQRFARGIANIWLQSSPDRIPSECPYFGVCGGCHYQHMPYDLQLQTKLDTLRDQLKRIGAVDPALIDGITPSPDPWNYRNQIQLQIADDGRLGFTRADGKGIVPIHHCAIAMKGINEVLGKISLDPDTGITRLTIREDEDGELFVLFEGADEFPPELSIELEISAGYLNQTQSYKHLAGTDQLRKRILGKDFSLSPASFFQINKAVTEALVSHVLARVNTIVPQKVLELYCGAGLFSAFIAPGVKQLDAIEASPSACYDFANNLDAFDHISLYEGPVEQILPALVPTLNTDPPDLVLMDPPRAGLHPNALDALVELAPKHIIYISCDPSTLARDIKRLANHGYAAHAIHAFDMFPQTYHVETMIGLQRTQRVTW